MLDGAVVQRVERWTCSQQVVGSNPTRDKKLCNNLRQVIHTCVPLSPSSKMHHTDNPILRTLIYLPTVKYEIMGLATKYGLNGMQCGVSVIKEAVWLCFKQNVQF